MGQLRLYLALCVVAAHSNAIFPWPTAGAREAVQIFFIVSGFYMQLVFGKYKTIGEFYASRALRIFVPYYTVLGLVMAASLISGWISSKHWIAFEHFATSPLEKNGLAGVALTSLSNLTIFFQDWILFLQQDAGESLHFTKNVFRSDTPLYEYLLIPQAWSVGLELTFYLFVPFLARLKTPALTGLCLISLAARIGGYEALGLRHDPWTYRFFPFELALFGFGMLACRTYAAGGGYRIPWDMRTPARYAVGAVALWALFALMATAVSMAAVRTSLTYAVLASYLVWAALLPTLFRTFRDSSMDREIGELSYPIYLLHLALIVFLRIALKELQIPKIYLGILSGIASVATAALLYHYILKPLEMARHRLARKLAHVKTSRQSGVT